MSTCDDMPALDDTRRVVRLAMVVDEVRRIARAFRYDRIDEIRNGISDKEFFICGGAAVAGESYSFYRQLVLAKRDVDAYSRRGIFPAALSIKNAFKLYAFYPSDDEDLSPIEPARVAAKDNCRLKRVAFVLKRFRRVICAHKDALATCEASLNFAKVQLSKQEFVACGGHRTVSAKITFSFYRQIVLACRDMRAILVRGRHCKADAKGHVVSQIQCISSDEDEEDVDAIDLNKTGPTHSLVDDGIVSEDATCVVGTESTPEDDLYESDAPSNDGVEEGEDLFE